MVDRNVTLNVLGISKKPKAYRVTRDVPAIPEDFWDGEPYDCSQYNFSGRDISEGEILYDAMKPTYGCAAYPNIALTFDETGDYPFFEFPYDAIEPVEGRG